MHAHVAQHPLDRMIAQIAVAAVQLQAAVHHFALQDFAVSPGWTGGNPLPNPPWHQKGLIDRYGAPKPAFSVVASIYHHTVQVGSVPRGR